jgi:hypothetical protein
MDCGIPAADHSQRRALLNSTKRPQFGAGRDLGPLERREGGSRGSATADHIRFRADVQF